MGWFYRMDSKYGVICATGVSTLACTAAMVFRSISTYTPEAGVSIPLVLDDLRSTIESLVVDPDGRPRIQREKSSLATLVGQRRGEIGLLWTRAPQVAVGNAEIKELGSIARIEAGGDILVHVLHHTTYGA